MPVRQPAFWRSTCHAAPASAFGSTAGTKQSKSALPVLGSLWTVWLGLPRSPRWTRRWRPASPFRRSLYRRKSRCRRPALRRGLISSTDIPASICLVQEHARRASVRIHPRRATQVWAARHFDEVRTGTLPYLGCWKAMHNSGGNSYENSVIGWCIGGCWFRYRRADLCCTRVSSSCC
jgi:hypothetical protein